MAVDIGPRIGIEGEAEYRKQINQIITQSKTLSSEMRLVESSFNSETTAQEKAAKKSEVLTKQIETQNERVRLLSEMMEKSAKETGENSNETLKWQQAVNNAKTDLNKMQAELDGYSKGVDEAAEGNREFDQTAQLLAKQQLAEFWSKAAAGVQKLSGAMMSSAKELDKGYDTIVKKTGATGDALEELKGIANDVYGSMPTSMEDVGKAVGEVNTRLNLTGDELKETSELFLQFAHINDVDVSTAVDSVQKALAAFGLGAKDTTRILNVMTAAGQSSGVGMNELASAMVKNAGALTELGLSAEQSIMFIGRLEKSGVDSETALSGMSRALKSATKQGKPLNQALEELEDTILNGTDGMSSLNAAYDLFGKSGDKIYNALKTGSISFRNLTSDVKDYSDVVTKTYEATISPWDKTKVAMNNLKIAGSELAGNALATLAPAIEKVTSAVKSVTDWFQKLSPTAQKVLGIVTALGAGAAILGPKLMAVGQAFSMMKTAATVAKSMNLLTVATAGQTIATEGATVAQNGLNASMLANPIVLLITGIAALTAGLAAFAANADWAGKRMSELNDEVKGSNAAYNEQKEALKTEKKEVEDLTERLKELQQKENLSTSEKAEMAAGIQRLNSLMPELNLQIDKQSGKIADSTGKVIENTAALEKNFDTAIKRYELAKNEERLNAALENYNQNLEARNEAEEKLNQLKAEQAALNEKDPTAANIARFNELQNAINVTTQAWANASVGMSIAENEYNALANVEGEVVAETEAVSTAVESQIPKWGSLTAEQQNTALAVQEAFASMRDGVTSALQSQMNMFEEFKKGATISTDTLLANMQSQIDGVRNWEANLAALADRGINENLLQKLADMGPQGANYVEAFVNMSDEELGKANDLWSESLDIKGFTNAEAEKLGTGVAEVAAGGREAFEQLGTDLGVAGRDAGEMSGVGFVEGLEKKVADAKAAGQEVGESGIDGINTGAGVASPSWKARQAGAYVGAGLRAGLVSQNLIVQNAAKSLGDQADVRKYASGHIASAQNIGRQIAAGLASGISQGRSMVISAASAVASAAIQSAQATLQVHSPSRVFEWIGQMVGAGFEQGVKESIPTVLSPFNDVGLTSGRDAMTSLDPDSIYSAVRAGAENANTKIVIGDREFGRILRGMGVVMA